jgi:AcrR family transcriptional regulator
MISEYLRSARDFGSPSTVFARSKEDMLAHGTVRDPVFKDEKLEIVRWAFDRFYEEGFHAAGIDSVMAGSGISKHTVHEYFSSKEELIEAVLEYYGAGIGCQLFDPAISASDDPRQQILAFFDVLKAAIDETPVRGCLGIRAAQEYLGKHENIAALGRNAALGVEQRFIEICERARFGEPEKLGKEINILFQGALLLSQVHGNSSPFVSAKSAVAALLEKASAKGSRGSKVRNVQ